MATPSVSPGAGASAWVPAAPSGKRGKVQADKRFPAAGRGIALSGDCEPCGGVSEATASGKKFLQVKLLYWRAWLLGW